MNEKNDKVFRGCSWLAMRRAEEVDGSGKFQAIKVATGCKYLVLTEISRSVTRPSRQLCP